MSYLVGEVQVRHLRFLGYLLQFFGKITVSALFELDRGELLSEELEVFHLGIKLTAAVSYDSEFFGNISHHAENALFIFTHLHLHLNSQRIFRCDFKVKGRKNGD